MPVMYVDESEQGDFLAVGRVSCRLADVRAWGSAWARAKGGLGLGAGDPLKSVEKGARALYQAYARWHRTGFAKPLSRGKRGIAEECARALRPRIRATGSIGFGIWDNGFALWPPNEQLWAEAKGALS
jgi:hypothetical protein